MRLSVGTEPGREGGEMAQATQTRCACGQWTSRRADALDPEYDDYRANERAYDDLDVTSHDCRADYQGASWAPRDGEEDAYLAALAAELADDHDLVDAAAQHAQTPAVDTLDLVETPAPAPIPTIREATSGHTTHRPTCPPTRHPRPTRPARGRAVCPRRRARPAPTRPLPRLPHTGPTRRYWCVQVSPIPGSRTQGRPRHRPATITKKSPNGHRGPPGVDRWTWFK